jgi:hypothetical protein
LYFYWSTGHQIPEDNTLHSPHCENLTHELLNLSLLSDSQTGLYSLVSSLPLLSPRVRLTANELCVLLRPDADHRQNTHLNCSFVVICVSVALVMHVHQKPLSSNNLFHVARGICSVKRHPADGHIPAFRRHVTIPLIMYS